MNILRNCVLAIGLGLAMGAAGAEAAPRRPNVVILVADQWRAAATGYAGDVNVQTPNLDALAGTGVRFENAVSTMPVCTPFRASLMTGQRPLTHGLFLNDLPLNPEANSLARVMGAAGYRTGMIGKWHIDGHGREVFIPKERRQGFEYWKVLECTHEYNRSAYYADTPEKRRWEGYDAIAQTRDAQNFIRAGAKGEKPFLLVLAWGPPHNPYETAPEQFKKLYDPARIRLRPNVPPEVADRTRRDLAGYYAHCSALDWCVGQLRETLRSEGVEDDTLIVFTSDHGDMLGSHAQTRKQRPWDESVRVPMLMRWPGGFSGEGKKLEAPIASEDLMPTVLGLCRVEIPKSVEGLDYSGHLRGGPGPDPDGAALVMCVAPFGEFTRLVGGREYRGVRTNRYTYVRDLKGPWLLYDNQVDPYQLNNLADAPGNEELKAKMEDLLKRKLAAAHDEFLPGRSYIEKWGYGKLVDSSGTVKY